MKKHISDIFKRDIKENIANVNLKKVITVGLVLNIAQLLVMFILALHGIVNPKAEVYYLIYIVAAVTTLNGIMTGLGYYFVIYKKTNNSILETIENIEALNRKLREQRHDYLNHIQVIYGLMELDEFEEAKKYMEPVYNDILKVSKALKTSQPAVNALLQAKFQMAEKYDVDMFLEIKSKLDLLPMEPWEFCKVISNIIDNGIHELLKKDNNRKMWIDIGEDMENYYIYIYNNGPEIPKDIINKIFEEGFTTKKEEDHGMGLFIVKTIINEWNGTIDVRSDSKKTSFNVKLTKKGQCRS
ncbi:MAG: sensor histidine kinase [Clostridium sp.]